MAFSRLAGVDNKTSGMYTGCMSMQTKQMTNGGAMLKRGDRFDQECARTSYRLSHARGILESLGIEPTVTHSARCADSKLPGVGGYNGCDWRCVTTWPEIATPDVFDLAYRLADIVQTNRGVINRGGGLR